MRSDVPGNALLGTIIAVSLLLLADAPTVNAPQLSLTAQEALFSPQVRGGQTLVWKTQETDYAGRRSGYQIKCKVLSVKPDYVVEWYPYDLNPGWGTYTSVRFMLRRGLASPLEGKMRGEPCAFFLVRGYGNPPSVLRVGTTWRFINSATGLLPGFRGTVTVTSLDAVTRSVGLHLAYTRDGMEDTEYVASNGKGWQHFQRYVHQAGTIDAMVERGGIIVDRIIHLTGRRGGSHTTLAL